MNRDYRILPSRSPADSDYMIHGVRYIVSSRYAPRQSRPMTLRDRFRRVLTYSAADLLSAEDGDMLSPEYGRSAAGKEA